MNEEEERIKKIVRPTEKTLDQEISKIATAMGVNKDQVIRTAIKSLTSKDKPDKVDKYMDLYERTKDMPVSKNTGGGSSIPSIQEIILYKMLGGIDKEEKQSNSGIDMEKMMSYQLLKSMFAPNMMEQMMTINMLKGDDKSSDKSDVFKLMMQQQQQSQATLMAAVFGKEKMESTQKLAEVEKNSSEQQLQSRLDFAEKVLPQMAKMDSKLEQMEAGRGKGMLEEMGELMQFQTVMKEFAKEQGYTKGGEGGKVDWATLATQILGMGKEAVSKLPASAPQPKPMQPLQAQPKVIPKPNKSTSNPLPKPTTTKTPMPQPTTAKITPEPKTKAETFTEPLISGTKKKK